MKAKQVVLFCNYTAQHTRSHLHLSSLWADNVLRSLLGVPKLKYIDAAPWIESFIRFFQIQDEYVLHIVAIQMGMIKKTEHFVENGVHYHYVKSGLGVINKMFDKLFSAQKKKGFPVYQKRITKTLFGINPDLVMICGAENPDYAMAFINNTCSQKLVILQTLMNDPKRIAMGISTDYRRKVENQVILNTIFFAVPDSQWISHIKSVNPNAYCFPFTFPTIEPKVDMSVPKEYDFVFFAGILGRNKGTNDAVSALRLVSRKHPKITLNIIGGADKKYMDELFQQVKDDGVVNNVVFTPSFPLRNDVFKQVAKSRIAVLPGITASLNSTVREAMLMGMPTVVYETPDTIIINKDNFCLLTAKIENINDLADKMNYALENADNMKVISINAQKYAQTHFSQESFNDGFGDILKKITE